MASSSLLQLASIAQATSFGYVACIGLLTYDYILTLPREIRFVWRVKWSPGKLLFLLVRYLGFIDMPLLVWQQLAPDPNWTPCLVTVDWFIWSQALAFFCAYAVFTLRTWAIWERGRITGYLLSVTYTAMVGISIYFLVVFTLGTAIETAVPDVPGCRTSDTVPAVEAVATVYMVFACFEAVIFVTTLIPGIRYARRKTLATFTTTMYRDAILGSACLFAIAVINAAMCASGVAYFYIPNSISRVLWAVIPGRIVLNIRESAMSTDQWDLPTVGPPISANSVSMNIIADDGEQHDGNHESTGGGD